MGHPNWAGKTIFTGDNLPTMRGMNSESVDLIYLDPPFNSKTDYAAPIGSKAAGAAFKDTWSLSDIDVEWINLLEAKHLRLWRVLMAAMTPSDKSYLAYMAVRLLEMHRILKPTGSIYLHCDPTMNHYLKLVMDAIFGIRNFRNEIVWRRSDSKARGSQHTARSWGNSIDSLLFFSKSDQAELKPQIVGEMNEAEMKRKFPKVDANGQRYNTKTTAWCSPSMGARPNLCYEFRGITPPYPSGWRLSRPRMEEEFAKGNIVIRNGKLERRSYAKDYHGASPANLWAETELLLSAHSSERTDYPTQKPLALLNRIIQASSNPGDLVFDPFCGCATACVAAELAGRNWVGIDISPKAAQLVRARLQEQPPLGIGSLFHNRLVAHREDIPFRDDLGLLPPYNCIANRNALYGAQGGHCAGCGEHFMTQHLEVDHIISRSKGGTDHLENLQLLCAHCNRVKGDRGMEYLRTKLQLAA